MPISIHPETTLVACAHQVPSPNCDERPPGCVPELIVVHAISLPPGRYGGPWIDRLFCNELDPNAHSFFTAIAGLTVSAHLLIRRDGTLVQYVPLSKRAWHAGESSFEGRAACNDFAIGIELEGDDDTPFNAVQYRRLANLCDAIMTLYPAIDLQRIVGHSDIAPGRKTDPGPFFEWHTLHALLHRQPGAAVLG